MKKRLISFIFIFLFVFSICGESVNAIELRASKTLSSYVAELFKGSSSGKVEITYDVIATETADLVGVSSIRVYRSDGVRVATFSGSAANGLLRADAVRHRSTFVFPGESGVSYYASLTVYAEIGNESDSRTITTHIIKAP